MMLLAIEAHEHAASSQNGELWACQIVGVLNSFGVFLHFLDSYVAADLFKNEPGERHLVFRSTMASLMLLNLAWKPYPRNSYRLYFSELPSRRSFPSSPPKLTA